MVECEPLSKIPEGSQNFSGFVTVPMCEVLLLVCFQISAKKNKKHISALILITAKQNKQKLVIEKLILHTASSKYSSSMLKGRVQFRIRMSALNPGFFQLLSCVSLDRLISLCFMICKMGNNSTFPIGLFWEINVMCGKNFGHDLPHKFSLNARH